MQMGFYFNQSRCIGCHTCVIACMDWHDLKVGINWRKVKTEERGKFPNLFANNSIFSLSFSFVIFSINIIDSSNAKGVISIIESFSQKFLFLEVAKIYPPFSGNCNFSSTLSKMRSQGFLNFFCSSFVNILTTQQQLIRSQSSGCHNDFFTDHRTLCRISRLI